MILFTKSENQYEASDFPKANAYSMKSPFEILQIRNPAGNRSEELTIYTSNTSGTLYASVPMSEVFEANESTSRPLTILHSHEYFEFLFVIDGEIYQNIEHSRHYYPAGGCCLVSPDIIHSEEYETECRVLFFKINKDFLNTLLSFPRYFKNENDSTYDRIIDYFSSDKHFIDFIPAYGFEWIQDNVHSIFEKMIYELSAPSDMATMKLTLYTQELLKVLFDREKFSNTPVSPGNEVERKLFEKIRNYMLKSDEKVTRTELEEAFNYTGDYLYKIIRTHTGLSINDYGSYVCMKKAADKLICSKMNINDIAESVGYHNYTHFYKEFYTYYGMTPREYRLKQCKQ